MPTFSWCTAQRQTASMLYPSSRTHELHASAHGADCERPSTWRALGDRLRTARVAQLVEHRPCKASAAGSSPAPGLTDFTWKDGERLIVFRRGALEDAPKLLREHGWDDFELLSTPRALAAAPDELATGAVHHVPTASVPEAAAAIVDAVPPKDLVALGGGRVVDVAKAIAAVRATR